MAHWYYTSTLRLKNTGWAAFTQTSTDSVPSGQTSNGRYASEGVKPNLWKAQVRAAVSILICWWLLLVYASQRFRWKFSPQPLNTQNAQDKFFASQPKSGINSCFYSKQPDLVPSQVLACTRPSLSFLNHTKNCLFFLCFSLMYSCITMCRSSNSAL